MTAAYEARLRKAGIALAVVLVHALAVRALLEVPNILAHWAEQSPAPAMTWILLPPSPGTPKAGGDGSAAGMPMQALPSQGVPELGSSSAVVLQPIIPALTLSPQGMAMSPDARVLTALGTYFACNEPDDSKRTNADRERCFSQLSSLRDIAPFQGAYAESKTTPFKIFGANGTFAFTPPSQPSFELIDAAAAAGCTWDHGLCEGWRHEKFGFDPSDPRRGSADAHFELGKGFSLDAGAQAWMVNYLGGARFAVAAGIVINYRW